MKQTKWIHNLKQEERMDRWNENQEEINIIQRGVTKIII